MCSSLRSPGTLLLLLLLSPVGLYAQIDTGGRTSYDIYLGFALRSLDASFAADRTGNLVTSTECGLFEQGTAQTFLGGLGTTFPVARVFALRGGLEVRSASGSLSYNCVDPASTRLPDGTIVPATTRHVADISMVDLALRITGVWRAFAGVPLAFEAGPEIWWIAASTSYDVREEIVEPTAAEFVSGGQVRRYASGDAGNAGRLTPALSLGGHYTAPFSRTMSWRLGVQGSLGLGDVAPLLNLHASQLTATLGLVYSPVDEPLPPVVIIEPPPLPVYTLTLRAVDSNGVRNDTATIVESREVNTRLHPLLPYLFFESGESTLPERYITRTRGEAERFSLASLNDSSTIGIYHNLLDIIGERMRASPLARLTITATQPDAPRTAGELSLASARADLVREYLAERWDIEESRLQTQLRQRPATESNEETPDGAEENRRVEFASDVPAVTAPIIFSDTVVQRTVPGVEATVTGPQAPRSWRLEFEGGAEREIAAQNSLVDRNDTLLLRNAGGIVTARAEVRADGVEQMLSTERATLPVRLISQGRGVRYGAGIYSLILFDFNSATLRPEHRAILRLVEARCDSGTTASIAGTTDVLGLEEHNLQLSRARAEGVARELRGVVIENVVGEGERADRYDNTLPEGRFYSRSVTITTRSRED